MYPHDEHSFLGGYGEGGAVDVTYGGSVGYWEGYFVTKVPGTSRRQKRLTSSSTYSLSVFLYINKRRTFADCFFFPFPRVSATSGPPAYEEEGAAGVDAEG